MKLIFTKRWNTSRCSIGKCTFAIVLYFIYKSNYYSIRILFFYYSYIIRTLGLNVLEVIIDDVLLILTLCRNYRSTSEIVELRCWWNVQISLVEPLQPMYKYYSCYFFFWPESVVILYTYILYLQICITHIHFKNLQVKLKIIFFCL